MSGAIVTVTAIFVGGLTVPASNAWVNVPGPLADGTTVVANNDTNGWSVLPVAINDASIPVDDAPAYQSALRIERALAPQVGQLSPALTPNDFTLGSTRAEGTGLQTVAKSEWGAAAVLGDKYSTNTSGNTVVDLNAVPAPIAKALDSGNIVWGAGQAVTELKRSDGATSFTFPLADSNQARQGFWTDLEQVSKYSSLTVADVPATTWMKSTSFGYQKVSSVVKQAAAKVSDLVLISEHYWWGTANGRYLLVDEFNSGKLTSFRLAYSNYPAAAAKYGSMPESQMCAKSMMVEYAYKALQQEHCSSNALYGACVAASAAAANYQDFGSTTCGSLGSAQ